MSAARWAARPPGDAVHPTHLWREAATPTGAHALAEHLLDPAAYIRTRGVAQQAARAARACRVPPPLRRRLLTCAWLHDLGPATAGWAAPLQAARALRRAGHEREARVVAHAAGLATAAALADLPPVVREFPCPEGDDADVLMLLDAALLTTCPDGTPGTPRQALAGRLTPAAGADPGLRGLVALVARLADDPDARRLVEALAPAG